MTARRFPVEAGHILQFARAVGETDERSLGALDDLRDGVPAPPTFIGAMVYRRAERRTHSAALSNAQCAMKPAS
ncbi:hypothetical protein [Nocardia sp. NPDC005366]|uniref:hypothetical protein n=1 Tax=Nocardia sp. NPDC005366 TaxID=3156878 RepID=UPI0033BA6CC1